MLLRNSVDCGPCVPLKSLQNSETSEELSNQSQPVADPIIVSGSRGQDLERLRLRAGNQEEDSELWLAGRDDSPSIVVRLTLSGNPAEADSSK
jgi:hypothetical protein